MLIFSFQPSDNVVPSSKTKKQVIFCFIHACLNNLAVSSSQKLKHLPPTC